MKDAPTMQRKEECASDMGQRDAVVAQRRKLCRREGCTKNAMPEFRHILELCTSRSKT